MIPLDKTTRKLQAFLSGAAATTNPTASVFWHTRKRGTNEHYANNQQSLRTDKQVVPTFTVLAGATETDICAAPSKNGDDVIVDEIHIYNADTAAVTVTVCVDDNGTNRILVKRALASGQTLFYTKYGWDIV